jgi:AraC-like DNA-binding protein
VADLGTISVAVLRSLLAALAAAGVDADAILTELGISYATLREPESRISTEVVYGLFARAPDMAADADFGLHAGAKAPLGTFEVLDHATRTSRTIGEALQRTVRFYALLIERVELRLDIVGATARITHRAPPPIVSPRAAVEMLFAIIVARGEALTGAEWPLRRVRFVHPRPEHVSECERFFHAPIEFGQPMDELLFDVDWLDRPLLTADEGVALTLERFASTLLAKVSREGGFLADVKGSIAGTLNGASPTLDASARHLGMSARTLQRRLMDAGTSYQALLEDVRRELAVRYLADATLTVREVGYLLGFSEPSAFNRAFRRWEGQTPNEYRSGRRPAE